MGHHLLLFNSQGQPLQNSQGQYLTTSGNLTPGPGPDEATLDPIDRHKVRRENPYPQRYPRVLLP